MVVLQLKCTLLYVELYDVIYWFCFGSFFAPTLISWFLHEKNLFAHSYSFLYIMKLCMVIKNSSHVQHTVISTWKKDWLHMLTHWTYPGPSWFMTMSIFTHHKWQGCLHNVGRARGWETTGFVYVCVWNLTLFWLYSISGNHHYSSNHKVG